MPSNFLFVQNQSTTLAGAGASLGATSITLTNFSQINGTLLTMANFGSKGYGTIEPGSGTQEESIVFTGITQNADGTATLTGVSTKGTVSPYTESSGLALTHSGGTEFIISNTAGFYNALDAKDDDATITGTYTFTNPNVPRMDVSHTYAGGENLYFATKEYADSISAFGAPLASTTTIGITELSAAPTNPLVPIAVGVNDSKMPTAGQKAAMSGDNTDIAVGMGNMYVTQTGLQHAAEQYAADTGAVNALVVTLSPAPTSYTDGMTIKVKVKNTNNSVAPTIAVNGLTATTICKNGRSQVIIGDLVANQIVTLVYDATGACFQLQSPPGLTPPLAVTYANGIASHDMSTASGNQTIAHGLGKIPKNVRMKFRVSATDEFGFYNGTTTAMAGSTSASPAAISSSTYIFDYISNSDTCTASITFDTTNITLAWINTNSPSGTVMFAWEAEA